MVNDKKTSKIQKFCIVEVVFVSLKFVGKVFVSSIISSYVITESSIILAKYFSFSQLHVAGFQI